MLSFSNSSVVVTGWVVVIFCVVDVVGDRVAVVSTGVVCADCVAVDERAVVLGFVSPVGDSVLVVSIGTISVPELMVFLPTVVDRFVCVVVSFVGSTDEDVVVVSSLGVVTKEEVRPSWGVVSYCVV